MNKISLEGISFRLLYYKYKQYLLFVAIILVSFFLLVYLVVPLIQEYFSIRAEEERFREKNAILRQNIAFVNALDSTTLDRQFEVASYAMSVSKDYVGVVNTLSVASERSGVVLGDYSFSIGDLATNSASFKQALNLGITITVEGPLSSVKNFIINIQEQLPLVEILNVEVSGNSASITTSFPFKPYLVQTFDYSRPFTALNQKEAELLAKIEQWYTNGNGADSIVLPVEDAVGSSSAVFSSPKRVSVTPVASRSAETL